MAQVPPGGNAILSLLIHRRKICPPLRWKKMLPSLLPTPEDVVLIEDSAQKSADAEPKVLGQLMEELELAAAHQAKLVAQVYIIKANNGNEVDGSVSLMNAEAQAEQIALDVKTFRDFKIIYRGLYIDNELSEDMRSSYYRLCFQKKQFLHDGLPKGLCTKLVVGMFGLTVSIAKIKNNKLTATKKELEKWNSTYKCF
ncbi:B3 DNA binding domain-containing protein [Artemisia annua]|uniref:B3 DNA binding domain-containing protein n=1 Tax=Artemisia annua TaxID=35608 RepID=A0A2U1MF52_ARTAN|nr:B3 DNA binding domain-containing protein [Artemisia annua]